MAIEIKIGTSFNDRDIRRAQAELNNLAKVTERAGMSMVQRMESTGKSMAKFGQSMTTNVSLPLVAVGALSVKAFMEQEDAIAKMESSLQSTGGVAGVTSQHIQDLAGSLQKTTTFADEVTVGGAALLLTFKNVRNEMGSGNDVFDRTIIAAQDLAAKMGTDLNSAVMQLGKALQDPEKGLTRLTRAGIQFTAQQQKQIREMAQAGDILGAQRIMIAEVESQFGGTAEAMANTASGKLKRAFNQLGEAGEAVGGALAPALEKVAGFVSWLGQSLASLPGPIQGLVVGLGAIVAAAGPVIWATGTVLTNLAAIAKTKVGVAVLDGLSSLRAGLQNVAAQGGIMGTALSGAQGVMGRLGSMLVPGGILLGGLALLVTTVRSVAGSAADAKLGTFANDVNRVKAALIDFDKQGQTNQAVISMDQFREAATAVRVELFRSENADKQPPLIKQIDQLKYHLDGTYESADKARERLTNFDDALMAMSFEDAKSALQAYFETMGWGELTVEKIADILPKFSGRLNDSTQIVDPAARAVLGLGDSFDGVGEGVDDAISALDRWQQTIANQYDPLWKFQDAVQETIDLKAEEVKKQAEVNAITAQFGPDSEQARTAMGELNAIQERQIVSAGTQAARWADLVAGVRSGEVPILKAVQDIDALAEQGLISADAARQQKQRFEELAAYLMATLWPNVQIPVTSNALEVLTTLQELETFLRDQQNEINRRGLTDWVLDPNNEFGRAMGGPVGAGNVHVVGERGSELFIPKVDGTIVPHYQSRRIMDELERGQQQPAQVVPASGNTFNITVNGMVGRDKREILDFLARELPKQAALSGRAFG